MTERKSTPPEAALVAIDIAKHRNEVLIDPSHGRRRRMTVLNTRAEHDRFIATLHALGRPVIVGIEPTGMRSRTAAWSGLGERYRIVERSTPRAKQLRRSLTPWAV